MMAATEATAVTSELFQLTVLGRTLEHLGVQLYKRRDIAIAELVANSWDAGATSVSIELPEVNGYDPDTSRIVIVDDGIGMSQSEVQDHYLVVGRNRRDETQDAPVQAPDGSSRRVMGRKGIGKLAGFGIARRVEVTTWRDGMESYFILNLDELKVADGSAETKNIQGWVRPQPPELDGPHGTILKLTLLKNKTPLQAGVLRDSLGRRFSRRVRGFMAVTVNREAVVEPELKAIKQVQPDDAWSYQEASLTGGKKVQFRYKFTEEVIHPKEMQGFTIYVRDKTAQAPPFFFNVEGTASGQHSTKYITGDICADYLDESSGDENDVISTDRQEIDWDDEGALPLLEWGRTLTRDLLRERAKLMGDRIEAAVMDDQAYADRIGRLEEPLRKQVRSFINQLGGADLEAGKHFELADTLIRAFEYQHFHDKLEEITEASQDADRLADMLMHLQQWKTLESRALLEIVRGRVGVVDTFKRMVIDDVRETTRKEQENLHDLFGAYPWLLNPDWQVMREETSITRQLRDWNRQDIADPEKRERYDFIALTDDRRYVIIDIKRSAHAVDYDDLKALEGYRERLAGAHEDIQAVMICNGRLNVSKSVQDEWAASPTKHILDWITVYERAKRYFTQHREVLEGEVASPKFSEREREVKQVRSHEQAGKIYRPPSVRDLGLGPQDVEFEVPTPPK